MILCVCGVRAVSIYTHTRRLFTFPIKIIITHTHVHARCARRESQHTLSGVSICAESYRGFAHEVQVRRVQVSPPAASSSNVCREPSGMADEGKSGYGVERK